MAEAAEALHVPVFHDKLYARYISLVDSLTALNGEIGDRLQTLQDKESWWGSLVREVEANLDAARTRVDLNVGGRTFATAKNTLLRTEGSYFHALLGSGHWEPCAEGAYFIDRSPELFGTIMDSLRSGEALDLEGFSERQASKLTAELDYYQLSCLVPLRGGATQPEPKWDFHRCSANLTLSDDGRFATKSGPAGWNAAVLAAVPNASSFRIRLRSTHMSVMAGYARASAFSANGPNYKRSGWFIHCLNGSLWSGFGDEDRTYRAPLGQGDLLEVRLDLPQAQIVFAVNGISQGVAFSLADQAESTGDDPLLPCVEIAQTGASVSLEALEGPAAPPVERRTGAGDGVPHAGTGEGRWF